MSLELETFRRIWELSKDSPYMAKMDDADLRLEGENAVCGDWMEISLKFKGRGSTKLTTRKILEARFLHKGCAVSAVAASVLLEHIEGKALTAARKLTPQAQLKLFGAPLSPARMKCALLPLEILKSEGKRSAHDPSN